MPIILIITLAIGLSMDAFSLSLIYGTLNLDKKIERFMGITVGIFHFFMPILGYYLGRIILNIIRINPDIIVGIIFILLGIEMIISIRKEEQIKILTNLISVVLFSLTVSIDSFSTGIAFGASNTGIIIPCSIFSIISGLFTYLGLIFGKKLSTTFGDIATLLGAIILVILGIKYLL